jgi:hypothetical protein
MKELRTEIEFEGTPQEVWAVLADLPAYVEWNPFMRKIQGEPKVGAKLEVRMELKWLGHLLVPLLWRKLRDGGTAKGFRAMNEALARRVADLRRPAN